MLQLQTCGHGLGVEVSDGVSAMQAEPHTTSRPSSRRCAAIRNSTWPSVPGARKGITLPAHASASNGSGSPCAARSSVAGRQRARSGRDDRRGLPRSRPDRRRHRPPHAHGRQVRRQLVPARSRHPTPATGARASHRATRPPRRGRRPGRPSGGTGRCTTGRDRRRAPSPNASSHSPRPRLPVMAPLHGPTPSQAEEDDQRHRHPSPGAEHDGRPRADSGGRGAPSTLATEPSAARHEPVT